MRHHRNTIGQTSTGGQPLRSTKPSTEHAALAALLDRAGAFAVVLSRGTSTAADVEGLGVAWANATRWWLDLPEPYQHLIIVAQRGQLDSPGAFLARNDEALASVVAVLCGRAATLFANCASHAAWEIVERAVAMSAPAAGAA